MEWRRTAWLALTAALAGAALVDLLQTSGDQSTSTGDTNGRVPPQNVDDADPLFQDGQPGVWVEPVRRVRPVTPPEELPEDVPVPVRKPTPAEASTGEPVPAASPSK